MPTTHSLKTLILAAFATLFLLAAGCSDSATNGPKNDSDTGVCAPGDTRPEDCNTCTCDEQGQWSCTEMACQEDAGLEDATDPECNQSETRTNNCNTCSCSEDGLWDCTYEDCSVEDPCEGKTCGDVCSTCVPGPDGDCPPVMEYCDADGQCTTGGDQTCPDGTECAEGDTQTLDCNNCTCTEAGDWSCSKMNCGIFTAPCDDLSCGDACTICAQDDPDCVESDLNKFCTLEGQCAYSDTPPECSGDETCVEGDTEQVECNSCVCDGAGMWNCTELDCSAYVPCAGLTCGETCFVCDPTDPDCPRYAQHYCDDAGACTPEEPRCRDDIYLPCAGLTCGDACAPCDTADPDCPRSIEHFCSEAGTCNAGVQLCRG